MPFYVASLLLAIAVSASGLQPEGRLLGLGASHRVMLMQQLENTRKPTPDLVLSLQQFAAEVVAHEENCSGLELVMDPVLASANLVINGEADRTSYDQGRVTTSYDEVEACSTSVNSPPPSGEPHGTCRTEQQQLAQNKTQECVTFGSVHGDWIYPACMYLDDYSAEAPVTYDCMLYIREWLKDFQLAIDNNVTTCTDSRAGLENKIIECDLKQQTFETSYCGWAQGAVQNYNAYASCYSDKKEAYNSMVTLVKASTATRKIEYAAAKQTKCLLLLLKEHRVDKPNTSTWAVLDLSGIAQCSQVDTDPLDPTYPDLPTQPPVTEFAPKPCDNAWLLDQYTSKTWYQLSPMCRPSPESTICTTDCTACPAV